MNEISCIADSARNKIQRRVSNCNIFTRHRNSQHNNWNPNSTEHISQATFASQNLALFSTIPIDLDSGPAQPHLFAMDTRENSVSSSAMPIPRSRILTDFTELFEIDQSQSSDTIMPDNELSNFSVNSNTAHSSYSTPSGGQQTTGSYGMQPATSNSNAMWSGIGEIICLPKQETSYNMDDDDIFQVDKADLYQGPTLAELNDDTILEDLNIDDYILQEDQSGLMSGSHPTFLLLQSSNSMGSSSLSPNPQSNNSQHQNAHNHNQHQFQPSLSLDNQTQEQHQQQHIHQQQDLQSIPINDMIFESPLHPASPMFAGYQPSTPTRSIISRDTLSPQSQASSNSSNILNHSISPPLLGFNHNHNNNNNLTPQHKTQYSTLQELLKKEYSMTYDRSPQLGQSVPGPSSNLMSMGANHHHQDQPYSHRRLQFTQQQQQQPSGSRLSSSAPSNTTSMWEEHQQQMWQRREPRQHLLSTGSVAEAESFSSLSTAGVLSPEAQDFSHDEGYDDSDSDHYEDYSTDNGNNYYYFTFLLYKINISLSL